MSTIRDLFQQAQLAEAAYANFLNNTGVLLTNTSDIQNALIASGFSGTQGNPPQSAQGAAFLTQWEVVDQYTANGFIVGDNSGFSATLFRNKTTGQYTFAVRGSTDPVADFMWADASLATGGIAIDQLVSMVNYVLRLDAGASGQTAQLLVDTPPGWPAFGTRTVGWSNTMVQGVGPNIPLSSLTDLTLTGHSLGGALAQMYQRIFGGASVDTFNSVGIGNPASPIFDQLTTMLGLPSGSFSSGTGGNLLVPGEIASILPGTVMGNPQIEVFSETQNTNIVSAHLMTYVTDSLALYNLFATLDPALNADPDGLNTITNILKASSNIAANTLESAVSALGKLFLVNGAAGFNGNMFDGNRDLLYVALNDIGAALPANTVYTLRDLSAFNAAQIASVAQNNPAYRYALVSGNPFALDGDDAIYAAHNTGGELDLYDPANGTGSLTGQYLKDRAAMLQARLGANTGDAGVIIDAGERAAWAKQSGEEILYRDYHAGGVYRGQNTAQIPVLGGDYTLASNGNMRQIQFGGGQGETITGGSKDDRLYGMAGDDTLRGGVGNDYLEGGQGADTYLWNAGDGLDTLLDTDGLGGISMDGQALVSGETRDGGRTYTIKDAAGYDHTCAVLSGDTGAAGGATLLVDNALQIHGYRNGDLGLSLSGAAAPAPFAPALTILGDLAPLDQNPGAAGIQLGYDALGNLITDPASPQAGRNDYYLNDSAGNDLIASGGGTDIVDAWRGGNDRIELGAGDDATLFGNGGDDIVIGGDGKDVLLGGDGHDRLYAGAEATFEAALAAENLAPGGAREFLDGGAGDDTLVGGTGNDALIGGQGNDLILGGAGDDDINADLEITDMLVFNWDVRRSIAGNTRLTTYTGISYTPPAAGGDDAIYAGAGADWVSAGYGDDYADGGAGDDVVFGHGGSDVILGGADNDLLYGDTRENPAAAFLPGSDYLDGGSGDDTIYGNEGGDILIGGADNDDLRGGAGGDLYLYGAGDGSDRITEVLAAGETNTLQFG
ncbi:MAG: Hemolysin-type calcium-binding domain-containing protein, partial [Gallionellaceae bacterium]